MRRRAELTDNVYRHLNSVMELQLRIIFFFIVIISSDTEEVKGLTATEGGSITLPDPVVELGFISYGSKTIAMVTERKMQIVEEIYRNRLNWDKNTGLFTITGLQRNDSGIYIIDSKKGNVITAHYKLTVYESVSPPVVNASVRAESCMLLCSVEKAEETTLLWFKGEEIMNQSSSVLSLPLTVHKQDFNSSYRCVAANPAENKTVPVNVTTSCPGQNKTGSTSTRSNITTGIVIASVSVVVLVLAAIITKKTFLKKTKPTARQTQDSVSRESEVQYTDIQISDNRQAGNVPDPSGTVDDYSLITVYDKLEAHRMILPYNTENV